MNIKTILNIAKQEFTRIFTDQGSLLIMVAGVFLYSVFYMVPFCNHIVRDIPIAVVDMDNTCLSREMIRDLNSSEMIKITSRPATVEDAEEQYYQNKVRAYVVIPKDFERDIFRGGNSYLAAYEDSSFLIVYKQVATGLFSTSMTMGAKLEIGSFMKKGLSLQQAMNIKLPVEFVEEPLFNPIGSYQNYIYPMVLMLVLQQTLLIGAGILCATIKETIRGYKKLSKDGLVIEDKIDRVNDFSDNPMEIVLGKSCAYVSLYFIYAMLFMFVFPTIVVYDFHFNFAIVITMLLFLFTVSFLAQALVYFYTERENSLLLLIITSVPFIFQPGLIWPKECIPFWLLILAKFVPSTPGIGAVVRMNQMGASFLQVQDDFWTLVFLCGIYFFFAYKETKRQVDSTKKN